MTKEKIIAFLASRDFKRFAFLLGIIFLIVTAFSWTNPEPFLKFGYPGIFVFALVGPAALLIPALATHMDVTSLALVTSFGYAINDSVSWAIGTYGHEVIPHSARVERLEKHIRKYGAFALLFWALVPFPYDLIGLISGYLGFPYLTFLVPTFIGRLIRFLLLGYGTLTIIGG